MPCESNRALITSTADIAPFTSANAGIPPACDAVTGCVTLVSQASRTCQMQEASVKLHLNKLMDKRQTF